VVCVRRSFSFVGFENLSQIVSSHVTVSPAEREGLQTKKLTEGYNLNSQVCKNGGRTRPQINSLAFEEPEPSPPAAAERLQMLPNQLRLALSPKPSDFLFRPYDDDKHHMDEGIHLSDYLCDVLHK
jgi:hypothetical protein